VKPSNSQESLANKRPHSADKLPHNYERAPTESTNEIVGGGKAMAENFSYSPEQFERDRKEMLAKQAQYLDALAKEGNQYLVHQVEERNLTAADALGAYGALSTASYAFFGSVTIHLTYTDSGKRVNFYGRSWGIGFGGVTTAGGGPFVSPALLVGGCSFHVQFLAVHGGVAQVTCWRDNVGILGQFTGPSLGAGIAEMGGSGTWSYS
jgi:hypothetical protein